MLRIKRYIPKTISLFLDSQDHKIVKWNNDLSSNIVSLDKEGLTIACDTIIRISGSRELDKNGYCEIQRDMFKKLLDNNYSLYVDYLIENKIIDSDNQYIVNEKSIGYRLNEDFISDLVTIDIQNSTYNKRSIKQIKETNTKLNVSKKHQDNFLKSFKIDVSSAQQYLIDCHINKIPDHKGRVYDKYRKLLAEHKLLQIRDGQLWINRSDGNGRIHTNLSNLNGDLKQFIYDYDLSLDIVSSQPAMLNILIKFIQILNIKKKENPLNPSSSYVSEIAIFPSNIKENDTSKMKFEGLKKYINLILKKQGIKDVKLFINDLLAIQLPIQKEIDTWRKLSANGNLYEYFQNEINSKIENKKTRSEVKTIILTTLYSSSNSSNEYKKLFSSIFPSINNFLNKIKSIDSSKRGYRYLAIILQAIESFIWIEGILESLDKQNIKYHFIHDSVIIKDKDLDKTELLILQEFNYFGFEPKIKKENLK